MFGVCVFVCVCVCLHVHTSVTSDGLDTSHPSVVSIYGVMV